MGDDVIDDTPEMIKQRSGVAPPTRMVIRDRKVVALPSNEFRRKSQGRREDCRSVAKRAKPSAPKQHLDLKRNGDGASHRSSHRSGDSVRLTSRLLRRVGRQSITALAALGQVSR